MRRRVKTWQGMVNDHPVTFFIDQDDDNTFVAAVRIDDREFHSFGHPEQPSKESVEQEFIEDEGFRKAVGLQRERVITWENHDEFI